MGILGDLLGDGSLALFQFFLGLLNLFNHRPDLRFQLGSLPLLLLVELRFEGNFLTLQVGDVAVEHRIHLIDFVEVLLHRV